MLHHHQCWLDVDPGHDDALAILLAGYTLQIIGISTVAGNQTVDKTTDNTLRTLEATGLSSHSTCPCIVKGQSQPLMRPPLLCPEIHGDSGLDAPGGQPLFPPPQHITAIDSIPAPVVMFEKISQAYNNNNNNNAPNTKIKLIATASLTNVALLLTLYPQIIPMIDIIIMGGCLGVGNTSPVAEFNIQVDPHSASIVFESGVNLTMVPLEVTHKALATPSFMDAVVSGGGGSSGMDRNRNGALLPTAPASAFRKKIIDLLKYFAHSYKEVFSFDHPPIHDACAVFYALHPEAFEVKRLRVDVETCSELSYGQTVVDVWKQSKKEANCWVCLDMDVDMFHESMLEAIGKADEVVSGVTK